MKLARSHESRSDPLGFVPVLVLVLADVLVQFVEQGLRGRALH